MQQEIRITKRRIKRMSIITRHISIFSLVLILPSCNEPQPIKEPKKSYIYEKYDDGVPKEIGTMIDSLKEGLWISFYPNGKINNIEFFDNGKWNGPWYHFFKNGQLSAYRGTKDGGFHGEGYNYHSNGIYAGNVNYYHDEQDGIFESYDEEGNLIDITEYKNGDYVRTIYGNSPLLP